METRKLYYEDCMTREFSATVTGCEKADTGYLVTLDATAFYPEGGGQACDLGALNDAIVLDVQEKDGNVYHLCDRPLEKGSAVTFIPQGSLGARSEPSGSMTSISKSFFNFSVSEARSMPAPPTFPSLITCVIFIVYRAPSVVDG